jgi:hypothetical protein
LGLGTGVFTRTVEEQIWLLGHILSGAVEYSRRLVPKSIPLPLDLDFIENTQRKKGGLRIGYFLDDGFIPATPGSTKITENNFSVKSYL